jgi:hypothetical protein
MHLKGLLKNYYNGWPIEHLGLFLSYLLFTSQNNANENEAEKGFP